MSRVYVTGGDGTIGSALVRALAADPRTARWPVRAVSIADFDIADQAAVSASIEEFAPDVVVHLAALAVLDACESDPARALAVNVHGTANVARACRARGARLVYMSSDYVFDGATTPDGGYAEDDVPDPVSVYGLTKLASERIAQSVPDHLVVRTSWVYGGTDPALDQVAEMLERVGQGREIEAIGDQVGSPTHADDLAEALVGLLVAGVSGCVHAAGAEPGTWYDVAGALLKGLDADAVGRVAVPLREAGFGAPRPGNSALDVSLLGRHGLRIDGWRTAVPARVAAAGTVSAARTAARPAAAEPVTAVPGA